MNEPCIWTKEQIQKAKQDFRVFLFIVWHAIGLPAPTEIQYEMAHTLMRPPSDRFIIQGFRGVAKSFITCAYCVWRLWKNPQLKVMVVSASKDKADSNAIFIKRIIKTIPFLSHLKANKEQRDTQNMFDVGGATPDISPSVKSIGITGQITGTRADILISDDVEVTNNSATQTQRDRLGELIREFDAVLKPNGQIVYLGTPQNEMSIYNELQKRGYKTIIFPVLYPSSQQELDFYGDKLAPYMARNLEKDFEKYQGLPTDPSRFNKEEIEKRRLSYGRAGFALQFMLNTNLSDQDKYPLKVSDLLIAPLDLERTSITWEWSNDRTRRIDELPCVALKNDFFYEPLSRSTETMEYSGTVLALDISGRGKDETAYAIVKYLNGYLFLTELGGYHEGYSDNVLTLIANKCKFYGVNEVVIEANFGDGMFTQLFKPVLNKIHPCAVKEVKHYKQKELRIIDTLEPILTRHKLIVNKTVIMDDYKRYEQDHRYSFVYQLTRISRERGSLSHDDRLDAFTMAVSYWLEVMDRDQDVGREQYIEDMLEQWLDPDRGIMYDPTDNNKRYNMNILDNY